MRWRRLRLVLPVGLLAVMVWPAAPAAGVGLSGRFTDDDTSVHERDIEAIAGTDVTRGCNPPANTHFCPTQIVNRGQMAAFLHRGLVTELTPTLEVEFADDEGSEFEADIEWLAAVGVTKGCNPPANTRYCPTRAVTRGEMAAFLVRALGLTDRGSVDFVDDDDSVFEADIERLAAAGITLGCNPPDNTRFCPTRNLTRGEMASLLARALGYPPVTPRMDLASGWWCAKDGLNCSGTSTSRAGRLMEVVEGWNHALPFSSGEETQFRSGTTRFELRVNDQPVGLAPRAEISDGAIATRTWGTTVITPGSGTFTIEGRWFWNGEQVRRTRITVSVTG
jgi:hypothetical protein